MSKKTKIFLFVIGIFVLGLGIFSLLIQPLFQEDKTPEPKKETPVKEEPSEKSQNDWIIIGVTHEAADELEDAIVAYKEAIAIQEVTVIPWINLASVLKKQGEFALARDAYENFIRIFPTSAQGYSNLADLFIIWQEGSVEDAIETLELGIELTDDTGLKKELERLQ